MRVANEKQRSSKESSTTKGTPLNHILTTSVIYMVIIMMIGKRTVNRAV